MALTILNNLPLTNVFQPSLPFTIIGDKIVLDFDLLAADSAAKLARIEWYPEYCHLDDNPNLPTARWFRELAEEDIGNGDVRMAVVVRRFSTNGADAPLPLSATHYMFDVQLVRTHGHCRIQIRSAVGAADACRATVYAPFGLAPST